MIDFNDRDIYKKANIDFPILKKTPQASKVLGKIIRIFNPESNASINTQNVDIQNFSISFTNLIRASKLELLTSFQEGNKERIGYIYGVPIVTKNATSGELSIQDMIDACFVKDMRAPSDYL